MRVRFIDAMAGAGELGQYYAPGSVHEITDRLAESLLAKGTVVPAPIPDDPYALMAAGAGETHAFDRAPETRKTRKR